jgi:hypothetical protein
VNSVDSSMCPGRQTIPFFLWNNKMKYTAGSDPIRSSEQAIIPWPSARHVSYDMLCVTNSSSMQRKHIFPVTTSRSWGSPPRPLTFLCLRPEGKWRRLPNSRTGTPLILTNSPDREENKAQVETSIPCSPASFGEPVLCYCSILRGFSFVPGWTVRQAKAREQFCVRLKEAPQLVDLSMDRQFWRG